MRGIRFAALLLGAVFASGAANAAPVLMISIDGLKPSDVLDPASNPLVNAPVLRALAKEGSYAAGVNNVLPTVTYPNHTTLITGVAPSLHGISNNTTFDPLQKNFGGWYWYASDIKVPTLWDAVHGKGEVVGSVSWPVSVGARSVTYNVPEVWRAGTADDLKLVEALSSPGLIADLEKSTNTPLSKLLNETPQSDAVRASYAAALIALKHPEFTTLHLVSLDHFEHVYGPGSTEAADTLNTIDTIVGSLIADARKAELDLVVAIVSDHGFAPISEDSNLMVPFVEAGLITLDEKTGKISAWDAMPWGAGGSAAVVLARPDDKALQKKVADLLKKLATDPKSGIARIADAKTVKAMGGAKEASFFVDFKLGVEMGNKTTGAVITASPGNGTHGYFPDHPEMNATFIINGPNVAVNKSLGVIDMRDIAPTLAKIMDVPLPSATGKPLF